MRSAKNRVVITGLGVISPIGNGVPAFFDAMLNGKSGVQLFPKDASKRYRSHLGARPDITQELWDGFTKKYNLIKLKGAGILYGCMAGVEAWKHAGLNIIDKNAKNPDWNSGCIFGTCGSGMEAIEYGINLVDSGDVKKMGGRTAQQAMNSAVSAYLGGIIGLGNQVTTNASACNTGTESILNAYERIKLGLADRMLAGSTESANTNIWGGYDSMRINEKTFALTKDIKSDPATVSAPMSNKAKGFVPGGGAGALILESLRSAKKRNATIYAEIIGGSMLSGAQRNGGSMTLNSVASMEKIIDTAIQNAEISPKEIDLISGHLPSYELDVLEIESWVNVLERKGKHFPIINALKSMTGFCFSASGSLEIIASVLQLHNNVIHPTINAETLHHGIASLIDTSCVPLKLKKKKLNIVAKSSFGFGDVGSCIILKKWDEKYESARSQ